MLASGKSQKEVIRPDFNRAIMIDFQRAKITSDTDSLLLLDVDKRFAILAPMREGPENDILGNEVGLQTLDAALPWFIDALLRRK